MKHLRTAALVFGFASSGAGISSGQDSPDARVVPFERPAIAFVANQGQWPGRVHFAVGAGPSNAWVEQDGFVVQRLAHPGPEGGAWSSCSIGFQFLEAGGTLQPEAPLAARYHFLLGADKNSWTRDVDSYSRIRFVRAWPGVDVLLRELRGKGGGLEYDLVLEPEARLEQVAIRVEGALALRIDEIGQLVVETTLGPLVHSVPDSWTVGEGGENCVVPVRFRLIDGTSFGFSAPQESYAETLVVDPGIRWSTYLGDLDEDRAEAIARSSSGVVLVTGATLSPSFPFSKGVHDMTWNGAWDLFVSAFDCVSGELMFSTFIGGSAADIGRGIAVGDGQEIWVAGITDSGDFPILPVGFDRTHNGATDGFVLCLDGKGRNLLAQTFLGTPNNDFVTDIALDMAQRPIVCGSTAHASFPTVTGGFDTSFNGGFGGGGDGFLTGFDSTLQTLRFSTFLGGMGTDVATSVTLGKLDAISVGGWTSSIDFPVTSGAPDGVLAGTGTPQDGFVLRLDSGAGSLLWSTYLGGSAEDEVRGLAISSADEVLVVGETRSVDFPLGSYPSQGQLAGGADGFYARLSPGGSLLHSTFIGGADDDSAQAVCEASPGRMAVVGSSASADFPVTPWGFDRSFNSVPGSGERDVFVLTFEGRGQRSYSTFLGGSVDEWPRDVVADKTGGVVLCGQTNSYNFPTPNGFDPFYDFSLLPDGFVTRMDFQRYPFVLGTPKVNSLGSWINLGYTGFPSVSAGDFNLWAGGGMSPTFGCFFWSSTSGTTPVPGGTLTMRAPLQRGGMQTLGWLGGANMDVPMNAQMIGMRWYYQFWYHDVGDPHRLGLSDGLEVLFYP